MSQDSNLREASRSCALTIVSLLAMLVRTIPLGAQESKPNAGRHLGAGAGPVYLASLQQEPADANSHLNLGRRYETEKDYPQAENEYRLALSAQPDSLPALVGLGRALAGQGKTRESLQIYDRALGLDSKNREALEGKAYSLLWMWRAEEAQAVFNQLSRLYPQNPEIAKGVAQADAAVEEKKVEATRSPGDLERTEDYYRQRLAKNPTDLAALKALAELTATPKDCQQSIKFSRKAVELAPGDPVYELAFARALAPCRQLPEAVTHYRRFLLFHPEAPYALAELGNTLLRAQQFDEAAATFRRLLQLDPNRTDASFGLARALRATKNYPEALARYDEVLKKSPDNYDALQGKAFVLYYTRQFAEARPIFKSLIERAPNDTDNVSALANIEKAEKAIPATSLAAGLPPPPPDASPQVFLEYYQKRLASSPNDLAALSGLGRAQAQLKNAPVAIQSFKRLLELRPDDRDTKMELARQLSFDKQYDASINLYHEILKATPNDAEALEAITRVYGWSGREREALEVYQGLLAKDPANTNYQLQAARLQIRLKDSSAARQRLTSLVASHPENRGARLELARLDLSQQRLNNAVQGFDALLAQDPRDAEALFGKAQALYYKGKIPQARDVASSFVKEHPDDFDAVFLLANIEHASGHRPEALSLLGQADRISPNNPEVVEMKNRLSEEAKVTITNSASYAREIGAPEIFLQSKTVTLSGLPNEDLRVSSYGTEIETSILKQVDSTFHFSVVPIESPPGPLRDAQGNRIPTTLTGAVVPWVFISENSWEPTDQWTVRGGAGFVRFGPGQPVNFVGQTVPSDSATLAPLAFVGASFAPRKKLTLDLNVAREAITDSPVSVKFGVMESRVDGGLNFYPTPRTGLHLVYYYGHYSSVPYNHSTVVNGQTVIQKRSDHDQGSGGTLIFSQNLFKSPKVAVDGGYSGEIYGFNGFRNQVYMGYYNPSFYQKHLATARLRGKLYGPLSYDFTGGIGVQQSLQGTALNRAVNLILAFTYKVSPRFSLTAAYTHYNTALVLGPLRGNEFKLSTQTKF